MQENVIASIQAIDAIRSTTVLVLGYWNVVQDGQVARTQVPCDGGKMRLSSAQASKSGASAFRLQSADISPTLFGRTPVVQLPKTLASDDRTLLITRTDRKGERHEVKIDDATAAAGYTFFTIDPSEHVDAHADDYDPNVRYRIERGAALSAADYVAMARERDALVRAMDARLSDLDALVLPTT